MTSDDLMDAVVLGFFLAFAMWLEVVRLLVAVLMKLRAIGDANQGRLILIEVSVAVAFEARVGEPSCLPSCGRRVLMMANERHQLNLGVLDMDLWTLDYNSFRIHNNCLLHQPPVALESRDSCGEGKQPELGRLHLQKISGP